MSRDYHDEEQSHGKWVWRLIALTLIITLGFVYNDYQKFLHTPIDPNADELLKVKIPRGSFEDVTKALEEHDLIKKPLFFQFYAGLSGTGREVKAGTFFLDPKWTPTELLENLVDGAEKAIRVVRLSPGLNMWRIANRIDDAGIAPREEFLQAMKNWEDTKPMGIHIQKPVGTKWTEEQLHYVSAFEGYIFPGTYELDWNATPREVIQIATSRFHKTWEELIETHHTQYKALQKELNLTDHDMVILASVVEKEAIRDDERPLIASVFYNRLRDRWRLDTDPSLVYHPDHYQKRPSPTLRRNRSNPYNTYQFRGLPPGPISNPGRASLEAVLTPADTDYYFFVAKQDGTKGHAFTTKDLKKHKDNIRKHLKKK